DIYDCRYNNWKDVGGADMPIQRVLPSAGSGTRTFFVNNILGIPSSSTGGGTRGQGTFVFQDGSSNWWRPVNVGTYATARAANPTNGNVPHNAGDPVINTRFDAVGAQGCSQTIGEGNSTNVWEENTGDPLTGGTGFTFTFTDASGTQTSPQY